MLGPRRQGEPARGSEGGGACPRTSQLHLAPRHPHPTYLAPSAKPNPNQRPGDTAEKKVKLVHLQDFLRQTLKLVKGLELTVTTSHPG